MFPNFGVLISIHKFMNILAPSQTSKNPISWEIDGLKALNLFCHQFSLKIISLKTNDLQHFKQSIWDGRALQNNEMFYEMSSTKTMCFLESLADLVFYKRPQGASGSFWAFLGGSGRFWNLLEASASFWELMEASESFWRLQVASGSF